MSTGNMPNPPDMPTSQIPPGDPQAQNAATGVNTDAASTAPAPNPAADIAAIIERDADTLAQRLVYHSQTMYGVGAVGVDIVNAKNSVLVFANALRNGADRQAEHTLANVGEPQISQVNDNTLPFRNNAQIAGLLEGLIMDTVARSYGDDAASVREARTLLGGLFQAANERMQYQSRAMVQSQAPGPGPNARR